MPNTRFKRLAITPGDPAGIGAEVLVKAAQNKVAAELVVFADPRILHEAAKRCHLPLQLHPFDRNAPRTHAPGMLSIVEQPLTTSYQLGSAHARNASYILQCIDAATEACLHGVCDGLVTGPISKHTIIDAGWSTFRGHTDYLAERCQVPHVVMMLASDLLRVALITAHIPLAEVTRTLSTEHIDTVLTVLAHSLQQHYHLDSPHIGVCGINPHAGEQGHLGHEEITLLEPALAACRAKGLRITGPLPADTAFTAQHRKQYDVIVAMYHDQGLAPFKALSFGESCNITLGLPFLRTSVDHGTAMDIATQTIANPASLCYAISAHLRAIRKTETINR
jgi:4-hydroxythreonine-4-phosphate dehydrogenase